MIEIQHEPIFYNRKTQVRCITNKICVRKTGKVWNIFSRPPDLIKSHSCSHLDNRKSPNWSPNTKLNSHLKHLLGQCECRLPHAWLRESCGKVTEAHRVMWEPQAQILERKRQRTADNTMVIHAVISKAKVMSTRDSHLLQSFQLCLFMMSFILIVLIIIPKWCHLFQLC